MKPSTATNRAFRSNDDLESATRRLARRGAPAVFVILCLLLTAAQANAAFVLAPDNGGGTATMPPTDKQYVGDLMQIIDGLPAASTIDINSPLFGEFVSVVEVPGGSLGGTTSQYDAGLQLPITGTGALAGYNRFIVLFLSAAGDDNIIDSGPRTPFTSPQSFDNTLSGMFGEVIGDPDFNLLRVVAGNDFGLPSPGHTTLTDVGGGNWNVDSFFDVTYRIDFVARPAACSRV